MSRLKSLLILMIESFIDDETLMWRGEEMAAGKSLNRITAGADLQWDFSTVQSC